MKFDTVAQWVIALTPSCRACSGAEECGFVSIEAIGLKVGNLLFVRGKRRDL
ncbi:hypothetical protein QUF72_21460 [Desulfobacterales bacterium HSG2]|nr:hypothetical protein [Desulfobacterales bacterium HSG2]